jgi:hypothetical protein
MSVSQDAIGLRWFTKNLVTTWRGVVPARCGSCCERRGKPLDPNRIFVIVILHWWAVSSRQRHGSSPSVVTNDDLQEYVLLSEGRFEVCSTFPNDFYNNLIPVVPRHFAPFFATVLTEIEDIIYLLCDFDRRRCSIHNFCVSFNLWWFLQHNSLHG